MDRELTVTCMVHQPPGRVAAMLGPLRSLEPEVVLAADDRVDPDWIEAYRRLADRVLVVPFPGAMAGVAPWLREQAGGRWILHLAADEVPSAALAARVRETIVAGEVTHGWIPRRWLHPDAGSYLAQWPWRPDYQLRLRRNDEALIRFPGGMHESVQVLGATCFLREPIYHADLLLNDLETRERKCAEYDGLEPGPTVGGVSLNEAYYLPERRDGLRLAPVPTEDALLISRFFDHSPPDGPAHGTVERFSSEDLVRLSERRELGEEDYRASLSMLDDDLELIAGEVRSFDVEVTNLGTTHWPGGMEAHPQIRLGYRCIAPDGSVVTEGRTPIGSVLRPGRSAIVPLHVTGPDRPGRHRIEIDLVHELVRWFEACITAVIEVRRPRAPSRSR